MVRQSRADARRNQQTILRIADEIFQGSADGPAVSMNEIADAAGVGKATLFRNFGDRAGLLRSVLRARTDGIASAVRSGPPPLGPGSTPDARVRAVVEGLVRLKLDNLELVRAIEDTRQVAGAPTIFESDDYRWIHEVLAGELARLGDAVQPRLGAHAILALTRADLLACQVVQEKLPAEQVIDGILRVIDSLIVGVAEDSSVSGGSRSGQ
ncbi:TetR/AcrR family transcriptional regulator [Nesterenkonia xinjiangensis]|uniref:AcrR family transcriptional regulator n=1 Tax=Nesterenkonia xinjiangensis TaxID=225327 RepID=A0A7Z0GPH4_9MICC|nr:TetR/AcrR family transcriptional regulator [Nesterenkonia xinjiangensis]NYJ78703.1 AcrR family transcriptional regulator [Nesterenkonia xinjiangensis]